MRFAEGGLYPETDRRTDIQAVEKTIVARMAMIVIFPVRVHNVAFCRAHRTVIII